MLKQCPKKILPYTSANWDLIKEDVVLIILFEYCLLLNRSTEENWKQAKQHLIITKDTSEKVHLPWHTNDISAYIRNSVSIEELSKQYYQDWQKFYVKLNFTYESNTGNI